MEEPISSRPRLSVVVAARNSARWIDELLESIVAQGVTGLEVIVVDNESTDQTREIVRKRAATAPGVQIVSSRATNAAGARNDGVRVATGTYLVFADSDDLVPDGAYAVMLRSLEASGSDMVIGDHLKFSATRTWSPTRRWYPFDSAVSASRPADVAGLLSGRACWNRMFRRSFWDRSGMRFPDIDSVEDIEPMTRAFVNAGSIDVVPAVVYLYRDRGDTSSLSRRADAASTVRYFEQERLCAAIVADQDVRLRRQHATLVYDADGWVHLHRFLMSEPDDASIELVARAIDALRKVLPPGELATATPVRRMLWELVRCGCWDAAIAFARGTAAGAPLDALAAWIDAVAIARRCGGDSTAALVSSGLLAALVNTAEMANERWLVERLPLLRDVPFDAGSSELLNAMARAVETGRVDLVMAVSGLRHLIPLVVARADASADGLDVGGSLSARSPSTGLAIELAGTERHRIPISVSAETGQWSASIGAADLAVGRHDVHAVVDGLEGRFPVVTARMPLPPLDHAFPIQPLADRNSGWRFLVDRREVQRGAVRAFVDRMRRKIR